MADWIAIEGEYRASVRSVREIAHGYGVSEAYIRKRAKKGGWSRDPAGTKRAMVQAALSGVGAHNGTQCALGLIEDSAAEAVDDMQTSLEVARAVLRRLLEAATSAKDPRDIKVIVEANKLNVETIRLILSLDEPAAKTSGVADVIGAMRELYAL
jgi:hypothetical protein